MRFLAGVESISGNGNVNRAVQYTGTYTVNSDCTGTVTFSDGSSPLDFVVIAGGNSLHFMAVGQGFNLTGTADRQ